MRRPIKQYCLMALAIFAMLSGTAGCGPGIWMENALSFALGAFFAAQFQTTSTEYRCFRDGVEVDCSELASFQP